MDTAIERIAADVCLAPNLQADAKAQVPRYVRRAVTAILNSCHRDDLPAQLEGVAAQMAEDLLRADGLIQSQQEVASVSRGDTSISYRDKGSAASDIVRNYEAQLTRWRRPNIPRPPERGRDA